MAGMPAWGGAVPVLGNNPFVIAVPRSGGHVVLDMAMSQFSYGKMQEYELKKEALPVYGGYDDEGQLTTDPSIIRRNKRALPTGYWKGAGLSMVLDVLLVALSGGRSTAQIVGSGKETGLTQCFISIKQPHYNERLIEEIIAFTRTSAVSPDQKIVYPGEQTLKKRIESEAKGVLVNEAIWQQVLAL